MLEKNVNEEEGDENKRKHSINKMQTIKKGFIQIISRRKRIQRKS